MHGIVVVVVAVVCRRPRHRHSVRRRCTERLQIDALLVAVRVRGRVGELVERIALPA